MSRLALLGMFLSAATLFAETSWQKQFEGADELPVVKIDGELAKIHSQGLFVTQQHYLVTGRLEIKPKRALLLRFSRKELTSYEYADITPEEVEGKTLDHPGGFDVDDDGRFWIPLSTSNRAGPSLICSYGIDDKAPLEKLRLVSSFPVEDHIGAICCVGDRLLGANWDTKRVYVWNKKGKLEREIDRNQLFAETPEWQIAVQDWKHIVGHPNRVILGGIDKSSLLRKATVQVIDTAEWKILQSHVLDKRKDVNRPLTNEGLCLRGDELYVLPEDIGAGAKVLRYDFPAAN